MQAKLEKFTGYHVEINEIEIYINVNGEKSQILLNKDTVYDLVIRGIFKEDKLQVGTEMDIYSYWNGGRIDSKVREVFYVKIKHPAFQS